MSNTLLRVKYSETFGFVSSGSSVIVYNSENSHIWSEEDMFTDEIEPIISKWVETIGVNIWFQKGLDQLFGTGIMMRVNCTQIKWILYSTIHTNQSI